ncbi:MAG: Hsp20/alpha crystallin family protein [Candidatus Latescibacteria bacterium]|nr:Hsp20/alpha crystallin family protein [Candidatus Latescibacterota bacterium]MCB9516030.1 Hsp20/alpha crystallin family protein [Candidatus Latescibacterota bacterium]
MTLIKWKPQHTAMNDFDRFWSEFMGARPCVDGDCAPATLWSPRVDIAETDKQFEIHVELPGLEKGDISLKVEDGLLTVSGERKTEQEESGRRFRRVERLYGRFQRSFRLPKEADADRIEAEFKNGLLVVSIGKAESVAGREIQVR